MGQWLQVLFPTLFFGWLIWAFLRLVTRNASDVPDRPEQTYSIFTAAFDRELQAGAIEKELATSGVRCGMPSGINVSDLSARARLADEAFEQAINSEGAKNARTALARFKENLSVCVLIDQSGSMVNQAPGLVGQLRALTEIYSDTDHEIGIFGFTTMGWHGGMARDAWKKAGRPKYPGRLCSLLHIVYKPFELPAPEAHWQAMLNPGLFFENVDGEALEWGSRLLAARPPAKKLLIVLSDGASVDDSTLMANGPNILERHLLGVIAQIQGDQSIRLGAIGLGYAVDRYYSCSVHTSEPEGLLTSMNQLTTLMTT
jgi:cobaltochelatase CobT